MYSTYRAAPDIDAVTTAIPIPGLGHLPVNSFVLHGAEPVLVDTCPVVMRDEYLATLETVIDPADLRWLWLTHTDPDHIGAVTALLDANPQLRVITTFFGVGIMGLQAPLPMDRVNFVNPGETIALGDRTLTGVKPPCVRQPDHRRLPRQQGQRPVHVRLLRGPVRRRAPAERRRGRCRAARRPGALGHHRRRPGCTRSTPTSSPVTSSGSAASSPITSSAPTCPRPPGPCSPSLLDTLARVPAADAFPAPDQAALDAMLAQMAQPAPA